MKRIFAAALAVLAATAVSTSFAHGTSGVAGGIAVGGVATGWAGAVTGTADSTSSGQAVAVGQVAGNGFSVQESVANSGGTATIGGVINSTTATVGTATTQYANIDTTGRTDQLALNSEGLIQNGAIAQAQTSNEATGTANFAVGQIGGVAAIGGVAGIAVIH